MNAVEVLDNNIKSFTDMFRIWAGIGTKAQLWSGATAVGSSSTGTELKLQRRNFDYLIYGICVYNVVAATGVESPGMEVKLQIGQDIKWPVGIDTTLFHPRSGALMWNKGFPMYAGADDDIIFTFVNLIAVACKAYVVTFGRTLK